MNDELPDTPDPAAAMLRLWSDSAAMMMKAAVPPAAPQTPLESARQMQATTLDAWSRQWDRFVRSPEFLTGMKQSLAAGLRARKQMNDLLGQARHELQGTSRQDVDQIMLTTRHLEQRIVDGFERLSAQLDELGARLDAIESES